MGVCKELKLAPDDICLEVAGGTLDELTTITASPVIDELLRRKEKSHAAGRRAVVDTRAPAVNEGALNDERL